VIAKAARRATVGRAYRARADLSRSVVCHSGSPTDSPGVGVGETYLILLANSLERSQWPNKRGVAALFARRL